MVHYENRLPPEGINVSRKSAGRIFLKLLAVAVVLVVVLVVVTTVLGSTLAKYVPFRYETQLMDKLELPLRDAGILLDDPTQNVDVTQWLQSLVDELTPLLPVKDDMHFKANFSCREDFNAFATLGGQMVFNRGLLRVMPSENSVAMVVAHEMAHVVHRDPIAGLGGGLASMAALTLVTGINTQSSTVSSLLRGTGALTQRSFSRKMEYAADEAGLSAVAARYGHTNGADMLFRLLSGAMDNDGTSDAVALTRRRLEQFSSTHPLDDSRIAAIETLSSKNGWSMDGKLTPLPFNLRQWMSACD